jgi:hypothetical protein
MGWYNNGSKLITCYWKDGEKTDLPSSSSDSYAMGIAVTR